MSGNAIQNSELGESDGARETAKRETRAALIRAALAEFAERGFDVPSLDAICGRAGYTRGAFYVHFRSRDDLVAAVMETVLGQLLDAVIGTDADQGDLAQTIDLFVGLSTGGRSRLDEPHPDADDPRAAIPLHQVLEACARAPEVGERLRQILGVSIERLTGVVDHERERGRIDEHAGSRELSNLLVLLALGLRVASDIGLAIDVAPTRAALGRLLEGGK